MSVEACTVDPEAPTLPEAQRFLQMARDAATWIANADALEQARLRCVRTGWDESEAVNDAIARYEREEHAHLPLRAWALLYEVLHAELTMRDALRRWLARTQ